jgi:hypothetical protein
MTKIPVFQGPSGRKPGGRKFEPRTGDYVPKPGEMPHGKMDDSVLLSVLPPSGAIDKVTPSSVLSGADHGLYSSLIDADLRTLSADRVINGKAFESEFVAEKLREWGYDARTVLQEPVGRRIKLARKLLREVHQLRAERNACPFPESSGGPVKSIPSLHKQALRRWAGGPLVLEKPQGSSMHHLVAFHREYYPAKVISFDGFEDFVVEHDWHAAFADKSKDFLGGEWRLPYDECAFEFRISGVRVVAFFAQVGDEIHCDCVAMGIHREWHVIPTQYRVASDIVYPTTVDGDYDQIWNRPFDFIVKQVRAVCIMLDARVAEAETRGVARELRDHRVKMGRTAQNDYRVVSLVRRTRQHQSRTDAVASGRHVKFHWRRGHWRHIQTAGGQVQYIDAEGITRSKTWINWMPVGDPDLGFVEKEYRL